MKPKLELTWIGKENRPIDRYSTDSSRAEGGGYDRLSSLFARLFKH